MTNTPTPKYLVNEEIDDHKALVKTWVSQAAALTVADNKKGVVDRFVRDCQTLLADLEKGTIPSCADLCDFDDTRRSLEVRFYNLTQDEA